MPVDEKGGGKRRGEKPPCETPRSNRIPRVYTRCLWRTFSPFLRGPARCRECSTCNGDFFGSRKRLMARLHVVSTCLHVSLKRCLAFSYCIASPMLSRNFIIGISSSALTNIDSLSAFTSSPIAAAAACSPSPKIPSSFNQCVPVSVLCTGTWLMSSSSSCSWRTPRTSAFSLGSTPHRSSQTWGHVRKSRAAKSCGSCGALLPGEGQLCPCDKSAPG